MTTSATGYTAQKMFEIEQNIVYSGVISPSGHLLLLRRDGTQIDLGSVVRPALAHLENLTDDITSQIGLNEDKITSVEIGLAEASTTLADANTRLDEAQLVIDGIDAKVATAKAEAISASELTAQEKADLAEAAAIAAAAIDAQAKADAVEASAIAQASAEAALIAAQAEANALAAAAIDAQAKADAAGSAALIAAAADAQAKADAAQAAAEAAAQTVADAAEAAAIAAAALDATNKANSARAEAIAEALTLASQAEAAAIAAAAMTAQELADLAEAAALSGAASDAQAKADAAQAAAIAAAATDASAKAAQAEADALAAAAIDAQNKAAAAQAAAISASGVDAQTKADAAEAAAIAAAEADATAKAAQAEADAIAAAALDAQTKASAAQAAAIAAAAADATTKANAARDAAIASAAITAQEKADLAEAAALAGSIPRANGAVTEAYLASNAVTATKIAANAIVAGKLAANAVVAANIKAGEIGVEKLAIGDLTNQATNPGFESGTNGWNPMPGMEVVTISDPPAGGSRVLRVTNIVSMIQDASNLAAVATAPGERWYIEGWMRKVSSGTTGTVQVAVTIERTSGGPTWLSVPVTLASLPQGQWERVSGVVTVPSLGYSIRARFSVRNDIPTEEVIEFDDLVFRRQTSSVLIQDGAVIADKIAAGAVVAGKLAADSVVANNIKAGEIGTNHLTANAVTAAKIAANTITAAEIATGAITADEIAANAVEATKIAAGAVVAGKLAANSVVAANIKSAEINAAHINGRQISAAQIVSGTITANEIASNAVTTAKLDALSVVADKLAANAVTAAKIMAGAVTADKLEANLVLASNIIAGNATGKHARLSPTGLQTFIVNPDGDLQESVRLGVSGETEVLNLTGLGGETVFAVTDEGDISANKASFSESIVVGGMRLLGNLADYTPAIGVGARLDGHFDKIPRGLVAYGVVPTNVTFNSSANIYEITFIAEPGRSYEIEFPSTLCNIGASGRSTGLIMRYATPTTPGGTTLGGQTTIAYSYVDTPNAALFQTLPAMKRTLRCNQNGMANGGELNAGVNKIYIGTNATSTATLALYNQGLGLQMTVKDVGLDFPSTGVYVYSASQPTTQTYTTIWTATDSASYNGTNNAKLSPMPADLTHGPLPGATSNNRYGIVVFNGNSVSSTSGNEVGKTIDAALSGATLVKAEVELYANHWYYNAGGTATIRPFRSKTIPTTGVKTGNVTTEAGWPKASPRWVDISTANAGLLNLYGVVVGHTGSTSLTTYGRFNGHTQSNKPRLRLTYRKNT